MSRLSIQLFGPFRALLDDRSVESFESSKVRALLAYLAVESDRVHPRSVLATMFWSNRSERSARSNLRYALYNLRQSIGDQDADPPFLLITRNTLQFNTDSAYTLDIEQWDVLVGGASEPVVRTLEKATALRRGSFLEGFSVDGSPQFEEWMLIKRERLDRQSSLVLQKLAHAYEIADDLRRAQEYVRQWLNLEPWDEQAHRQLMQLLAWDGRRNEALRQYGVCRDILHDELGLEPTEETDALYRRIRDGRLEQVPRQETPDPRERGEEKVYAAGISFVGRQQELDRLNGFLRSVQGGEGGPVFVAGEAGGGKTALIREFARQAMETTQDVATVGGTCSAHTGIGDPYSPFRAIIQSLSGVGDAGQNEHPISQRQLNRLWGIFPEVVRILVDAAPRLVGTIIPARDLLNQVEAFATADVPLTRLRTLIRRTEAQPRSPVLQQDDLFEQITRFFAAIARHRTLIVIVDDLQWADSGTLSLLFHLAVHLRGSPILFLGAYRPEQVGADSEGRRHPLLGIVNELQRIFGAITIDLDRTTGEDFVDAFLDSAPNRLDASFRRVLTQHTNGNPLFTIELIRGLIRRGDLIQNEYGEWVIGARLNWERLPARVEAIIAERIGRLPAQCQRILQVASVEGTTFTAEVVSDVLGIEEGRAFQLLSGPLTRQQGLICPHGVRRLGSECVSRYRFQHILFQKYLYQDLGSIERVRLHEEVGKRLERVYVEDGPGSSILPQLARHFEEAQVTEKAVEYLQAAGKRALTLSAHEETIALFTRALDLLSTLPDTPERGERELEIQLLLGVPLLAIEGWGSSERADASDRAFELCRKFGSMDQLLQSLFTLADLSRARGKHRESLQLGQQMMGLTERVEGERWRALAHWTLGETLFFLGEFQRAREHLEPAIHIHEANPDRSLLSLTGPDLSVASGTWLSWVSLILGRVEEARRCQQTTLQRATRSKHPLTSAFAEGLAGCGFGFLADEDGVVRSHLDSLLEAMEEDELPAMSAWAMVFEGWVQGLDGDVESGIARIEEGMALWAEMGALSGSTFQALPLVKLMCRDGQFDEALDVLEQTLDVVEATDERCFEAELLRLKARVIWQLGHDEERTGETLERAWLIAVEQNALLWQLRVGIDRVERCHNGGQRAGASRLLREVVAGFEDESDLPNLRRARQILGMRYNIAPP